MDGGISWVTWTLVVIFGSCSWMGTNSVWMQLPFLTNDLPEKWNLPSYLTVIIQISCIAPAIYTIVYKFFPRFKPRATTLIPIFIALGCVCQLCMGLLWKKTAVIFGAERSISLYVWVFGLAVVDAMSNVLNIPFMAQFQPRYLSAYFVGMGFSALLPSILALIQGMATYTCVDKAPVYTSPLFGVTTYFLIVFGWTVFSAVCYFALFRGHAKAVFASSQSRDSQSDDTATTSEVKSNEALDNTVENIEIVDDTSIPTSYILLLLASCLINAQMNGVIPSIQTYAALPYSQAVYHYGLTFGNVVSPLVSFIPMIFTLRSKPVMAVLTVCSSITTAFIVYLAALSPNMLFNSENWGGAASITAVIVAMALHSYLRVTFASEMREGQQSENRLFWCGLFIQAGSFIGSIAMFPLVNVAHLFKDAPQCR